MEEVLRIALSLYIISGQIPDFYSDRIMFGKNEIYLTTWQDKISAYWRDPDWLLRGPIRINEEITLEDLYERILERLYDYDNIMRQ